MIEKYEIWIFVPAFADTLIDVSGHCEVSSLGRVRTNGRLRALSINKRGYSFVSLSSNGWTKTFKVHRLVAMAFHGSPGMGMEVNHINAITTDNRSENLEWVSHKQNVDHAQSLGLYRAGESHNWSKLTEQDVIEIRKARSEGVKRRVVAEKYGMTEDGIKAITTRRVWKHIE